MICGSPADPQITHSRPQRPIGAHHMITTLEHASIGFPLVCRGITLFPLYVHQADVRVTAGGDNDLEISERPDAEVPSLRVRNRAVHPVLLVEGETVLGGRQNRVINTTIVVPAA